MGWRTYLVMYFGAKKKRPSEIAEQLQSLGFETIFGSVDFIYNWKERPSKEKVLELGDKISELLEDSGTVFNLDTHE